MQPDTDDARRGVPVDDALLALLPLLGQWQGTGSGVDLDTGAEFSFAQRMSFAHDGRGFLVYESRTWLLDGAAGADRAEDAAGAPGWRESGFWRRGAGEDDVELVLATADGLAMQLAGLATDRRWELGATAIALAPTAVPSDGERRLYALLPDGQLGYVIERAPGGGAMRPWVNARLRRG